MQGVSGPSANLLLFPTEAAERRRVVGAFLDQNPVAFVYAPRWQVVSWWVHALEDCSPCVLDLAAAAFLEARRAGIGAAGYVPSLPLLRELARLFDDARRGYSGTQLDRVLQCLAAYAAAALPSEADCAEAAHQFDRNMNSAGAAL